MPSRKLDSLQVLRGFAASAVVLHHSLRAVTVNRPIDLPVTANTLVPPATLIQLGAFGVDVFFILSGFLMMYISGPYFERKKSVWHFFAHRLIRIWPLYALVTGAQCCLLLRTFIKTSKVPFDLHPIRLASFLFIPSLNEKGLLQPILGVGWTLNYEMLFYVCFAGTLISGPRYAMLKITALLITLFALGIILRPSIAGEFLGEPIMFEFLFGAALGSALRIRRFDPVHPYAWITGGLILLVMSAFLPAGLLPRPILWGIPALLIFIGFFALEKSTSWPAWMQLIGDASYSIYLIHILVIYRVVVPAVRILQRLGLDQISIVGASFAALLGAMAAGLCLHFVAEKPIIAFFKALTERRSEGAVSETP
jgi:peptidoglycan/LPS O-acetylase OafA/YrhL